MKKSHLLVVLFLGQMFASLSILGKEISLSGLSLEDPNYLETFTTVQKNHYQTEKWDAFFSHAIFYRHKFLNGKGQLGNFYSSSLVTLEVLALSKHCQWEQAKSTLSSLMDLASDQEEIKKELKDLRTKVELMEAHQIKLPVTEQKEKKPVLPKKLQWKADSNIFAKLKDPSKIKVKVQNLCQ